MPVHRPFIKSCKLTDTSGKACAKRQRPEVSARPQLKVSACGLGLKSFNFCIRSPRKKEELVEIAWTKQFRFALRHTDILGKLSWRKCAKGNRFHVRVFRKLIQSLLGSWQRRRHGDDSKACKANGVGRLEVEVIFRKVNTGAAFGNKRRGMAQFADGCIEFVAIARANPDTREISLFQPGQKFRK